MKNELYNSKIYIDDVLNAVKNTVNFERLQSSSVLITGATGLIGSFITDMLLESNREYNSNITVYATGRSIERLKSRFDGNESESLYLIEHDVNDEITFDFHVDYVIHAAGNAYPAAFNTDPVGTVMSNVLGTYRLLQYGKSHGAKRFLFVSSGEVYGQGDLSLDSFKEDYGGYIDSVQPRSCYPNSKRTAETLCSSFTKQFGLDTVIARPCHTYGPNTTSSDNRANVQFINNVMRNEDIVLKSAGSQMRSYCYIADCGAAVLTVLINGESCNAYNTANKNARTTIAGFAGTAAELSGRKVVFEKPDEAAIQERTPIAKQVLSSEKLESLGWKGQYSVTKGIDHTLKILRGE